MTEASAMPAAAMRMVFTMPTQSARPPVPGSVSMPAPTLMPMWSETKSKLMFAPLALRLSPASVARNHNAAKTAMSVPTCAIQRTTVASR